MQKPITQRRAKLTAALRAQLDCDYDAGVPIAEIAAKYGCDPSYPGLRAKRSGRPRRLLAPGEMARLRRLRKLNQRARDAQPIEGDSR